MGARIRTLGQVRVTVDGSDLALTGRLPRRILLRLLLGEGGPVTADSLMEAAWGSPTSMDTLRVQISRLRRALAPAGIQINSVRRGWQLDRGTATDDRRTFDGLVEALMTVDAPARIVELAGAALELWGGQALEDVVDEEWATAEAQRLEHRRVLARQRRSEAYIALGAHDAAITDLGADCLERPDDERSAAWLAAALAASGRGREGHEVITRLRDRLRDDLGIDPSPMVENVDLAILRSHPDPSRLLSPCGPLTVEQAGPGARSALIDLERRRADPPQFLVGRDMQWRAVLGADGPHPRHAVRVIAVTGEEGVGKSTFARALAEHHQANGRADVLVGHCRERSSISYEPLLAASRYPRSRFGLAADTDPVIGSFLNQQQHDGERPLLAPEDVGEAFLRVAVGISVERPLVLVLEDLHWATDATLRAVQALIMASQQLGGGQFGTSVGAGVGNVTLIVTHRPMPGQGAEIHRLDSIVGRTAGARMVPLGGLDEDGVAAMLRQRGIEPSAELVAEVVDLTEGNPLFVSELAVQLTEEPSADRRRMSSTPAGAPLHARATRHVPPVVEALTMSRLSGLSDTARTLLGFIACARGQLAHATLRTVSDDVTEEELFRAIDECVAADVAVDATGSDAMIFRHHYFERVVLDQLTLAKRQRLHHRLGDALARSNAHPADVAAQYRAAGSRIASREVAAWLLRAAEMARIGSAFQEARELAEDALNVLNLDRCHDALHATGLFTLTLIAANVGDSATVKRAAVAAVSGALAVDELTIATHAAQRHGAYGCDGDQDHESLALFATVRAGVDGRPDLAAELDAHTAMHLAMWGGRADVARPIAEQALATARQLGRADCLRECLYAQSVTLLATPDLDRRATIADALWELGVRHGSTTARAYARRMGGITSIQRGDLAAVQRAIDDLELSGHAPGHWTMLADASRWRAMLATVSGDWAAGLAAIEQHRVRGRGVEVFTASTEGQLALLAFEQGRLRGDSPVFDVLKRDRIVRMAAFGLEGLVALERHDRAAAASALEVMMPALNAEACDRNHLGTLALAAMLADALDAVDAATTIHRLLQPYAGQFALIAYGEHVFGAVDRHLGAMASVLGDHDYAGSAIARARAQESANGWDVCVARTMLAEARALRRAGSRLCLDVASSGERMAAALGMASLARSFGLVVAA